MLLQPLGMTDSYFAPVPKGGSNEAKGYVNGKEKPVKPALRIASGGLSTSANDLARFVRMALANGKPVLRPATFAEMLRRQNAGAPLATEGDARGLGWALGTFRNSVPSAEHGGTLEAFSSQLKILPQQQLGVVVLANSSNNEAIDKIADEILTSAFTVKTGQHLPPMPSENTTVQGTLTPAQKQAFIGQYATYFGHLNVFDDGGKLRGRIGGKTFSFVPTADGKLKARYRLLGILPVKMGNLEKVEFFLREQAGHTLLLASRNGIYSGRLFGYKIRPVPLSAVWQVRTGHYRIAKPHISMPSEIRLMVKEGLPMMQMGSNFKPLLPVSAHEAVANTPASGETLRFSADGKTVEIGGVPYIKRK